MTLNSDTLTTSERHLLGLAMVTENHVPSQASNAQRPPMPPTSPIGLMNCHRPLETNVNSKHMYTRVHATALLTAAESCKESKCASRDEWRPRGRYTQQNITRPQRARNFDTRSNTAQRQTGHQCTAPLPEATPSRQSGTDREMTMAGGGQSRDRFQCGKRRKF